jgi:hypothetical protein
VAVLQAYQAKQVAAVCSEIFEKLILKTLLLQYFTKISRDEIHEIAVKEFQNQFSNWETKSLTPDLTTLFPSNPLYELIIQEYIENPRQNFAGHDARVLRILEKLEKEKELLAAELAKSVTSFREIFVSSLIFLLKMKSSLISDLLDSALPQLYRMMKVRVRKSPVVFLFTKVFFIIVFVHGFVERVGS